MKNILLPHFSKKENTLFNDSKASLRGNIPAIFYVLARIYVLLKLLGQMLIKIGSKKHGRQGKKGGRNYTFESEISSKLED